jgi:hypothetical protein
LVQQALAADWSPSRMAEELEGYLARHRTDDI